MHLINVHDRMELSTLSLLTKRRLRGLTGIALDNRSLPPVFESRREGI